MVSLRTRPRRPAVPRWRPGDDLAPLVALVRRGGVLAVPTESSYALAVDPLDARAVAAVCAVKGRRADKPLPVVFATPSDLAPLGIDWPSEATGGLERLWPAALSLLLPTRAAVPAAAGSGRLAVRVPDHPQLVSLLAALGTALTATSANRSGKPPILDPAALDALLAGRDAMVVDGGVLAGGPPSTLVAVDGAVATILRPGRVDREALARAAPGLELRPARFSTAAVEIPVEETS